MINNNTPKTTVTVAKVSESDIYVKQSDLEKMTLGSFKNDMGYISSSALALWMKEHSYLSKNEINTLINKANLVVIDSINKQYDEDALRILDEKVNDLAGEIVAIKDKLREIDGNYIVSDKEGTFATKSDIRIINTKIQNITTEISSIDLSNLATKAEIPVIPEIPSKVSQLENDKGYLTKHQSLAGYAKSSEIPDVSKFVKKDELPAIPTGLASQQWVKDQGYLKEHQSLKGYAKKTDLNGLASKEWVEELLETPGEIDLSGYAKTTDLDKLTSTVTSISSSLKSYAKKGDLPDTSQFITKEDIPSVDGLASKDWVAGQGYLKEHQSLKGYAKKADLDKFATQEFVTNLFDGTGEIDLSGYAKKTDIPTDYVKSTTLANKLSQYAKKSELNGVATQTWVQENFLSEEQDMSEYAKKTDIPTDYVKTGTLSQYQKKKDALTITQVESKFITKTEAAKTYITPEEVAKDYMTISDVQKDYLRIEDYRGLRNMLDAVVLNRDFINMTEEEFRNYVDEHKIFNGFYLIKDNKLCVVQGNTIISVIKDGLPQPDEDKFVLEWEEE